MSAAFSLHQDGIGTLTHVCACPLPAPRQGTDKPMVKEYQTLCQPLFRPKPADHKHHQGDYAYGNSHVHHPPSPRKMPGSPRRHAAGPFQAQH